MMDENYRIICEKDGVNKYSNVHLIEEDDKVQLEFEFTDFSTTIQSDNFFEALIALRKKLEYRGYKLLCKGSCKNVYPSGMLLSMGMGRKAYVLTRGEQARMNCLVDIFEP